MKKIMFLFIAVHCSFIMVAQNPTVSIVCDVGSPSCFFTDPTRIVDYIAQTNDGNFNASNGWTKLFSWGYEPSGSFFRQDPSNNTSSDAVSWNNEPNFPERKVKVTVTYSKPMESNVVITAEQVVTVKYIAPISSMTVSGGSPSAISNSGGSTTVPCGVSTFTVSVPTPTTDPSTSVNYSWTLPSGWSGSSTYNAIIVTTNAGANDGTITARARRSDWNGTFEQTFSVNVNRPRVGTTNISGSNPRLVCDNETKTFTAITTNATSFSWQTSGGVSISGSSTGSSVAIQNSSSGTLQVTANNACQVPQSKTVEIFGTPVLTSATVNGYPAQSVNNINNPAYLVAHTNNTASSYSWNITGGTGSIYPNGSSCSAYAYPFVVVKVSGTNICGSTNLYTYYLQNNSGGGYYRMSSPNPTSDRINIDFEPDVAQRYLESVTLLNERRGTLTNIFDVGTARANGFFDNNNRLELDVSILPRGTYYLVLNFINNKTFQELIVLE